MPVPNSLVRAIFWEMKGYDTSSPMGLLDRLDRVALPASEGLGYFLQESFLDRERGRLNSVLQM